MLLFDTPQLFDSAEYKYWSVFGVFIYVHTFVKLPPTMYR